MHYAIFIPRGSGADPKQLIPVGLGHLLRDGDASPQMAEILDGGPDGGPGLLFVWAGPTGDIPAYRPGELTWLQAKADEATGLAKGRFWWGYSPASPPSPEDLCRKQTLRGMKLVLRGGEWLLPNILMLPHDFILNDEGKRTREVTEQYAALYARGQWAYGLLETHVKGEGRAPEDPLCEYVIDMLALNYRVFRDLVYHLRLMNDGNWFSIACNTVDILTLTQLEEEFDAKKKAGVEALITQHSSPPGDGPTDSPPPATNPPSATS